MLMSAGDISLIQKKTFLILIIIINSQLSPVPDLL